MPQEIAVANSNLSKFALQSGMSKEAHSSFFVICWHSTINRLPFTLKTDCSFNGWGGVGVKFSVKLVTDFTFAT